MEYIEIIKKLWSVDWLANSLIILSAYIIIATILWTIAEKTSNKYDNMIFRPIYLLSVYLVEGFKLGVTRVKEMFKGKDDSKDN